MFHCVTPHQEYIYTALIGLAEFGGGVRTLNLDGYGMVVGECMRG